MSSQYDIESFLVDMATFLQANLNTQIAAMNTEKNDSITLLTIPTAGYFFQTLNDEVTNYNPFLFYGINGIENKPAGPATVKKYNIDVVIILADQGTDLVIGRRMLRYMRVLEDLFHSNFGKIGDTLYLKISSLEPVPFQLNNADTYRAAGVELEVQLG